MKFENISVMNFKNAIRGMRNPKESWDRLDSCFFDSEYCDCKCRGECAEFKIGPNDLDLMQRLIKAGPEHRKFMRQIFVSVDITAPIFLWKEIDTYKIGTTANSTSTMHKIQNKPITKDLFEIDDYNGELSMINDHPLEFEVDYLIDMLEQLRQKYLDYKNMARAAGNPEEREYCNKQANAYWKELIRWLPCGWLQTRTMTMNYEILYSWVRQRNGHKLTEWFSILKWITTLPYAKELIFCGEDGERIYNSVVDK